VSRFFQDVDSLKKATKDRVCIEREEERIYREQQREQRRIEREQQRSFQEVELGLMQKQLHLMEQEQISKRANEVLEHYLKLRSNGYPNITIDEVKVMMFGNSSSAVV